ncbi:MAG TPA: glutathione S-transferase family protein [Polyangiaceae bacterium]|nr:glutathione S-transferase family protein [Polyangiaceae bacterium]
MPKLTLVSHHLCPYVQRVIIALDEKGVSHERVYIDLANKPDWFTAISPRGKVPLLKVDDDVLFESAAICEYIDETAAPRLHPEDPVERAKHRGWMEFASVILGDIWGFETATDEDTLKRKAGDLRAKFAQLEPRLGEGPYFAGSSFHLVDAVFGPIFRYFDVFDAIGDFGILSGLPKVRAWRAALAARPSVRNAVTPDYPERLRAFLRERNAYLERIAS